MGRRDLGLRIVDAPAELDAFRHCECGCGRALHGRDHVEVRGRYVWRAWDRDHAARIVERITAHPFVARW